jgi:hypothetical protein
MNATRPTSNDRGQINASIFNPEFLRQQARWIRDDLDPQVARDGPDALHSDDLLTLDSFLRKLLSSKMPFEDIQFSRLHLAIIVICGKATRWPSKLIERADALQAKWEDEHGCLKSILPLLYEPGGRLNGICKPEDLTKEKVIINWLKTPDIKLSPLLARRVGNLGFTPGEYAIFFIIHPLTLSYQLTIPIVGGSVLCLRSKTASLTQQKRLVESLRMPKVLTPFL